MKKNMEKSQIPKNPDSQKNIGIQIRYKILGEISNSKKSRSETNSKVDKKKLREKLQIPKNPDPQKKSNSIKKNLKF